jgi:hypothetical protein
MTEETEVNFLNGGEWQSKDSSRREILTIAASTFVTSLFSGKFAAAAPILNDTPPFDEGFFFVIPGTKQSGGGGTVPDPEADRVFFISASWLPYFEVTNILGQPAPVQISQSPSAAADVTWSNHNLSRGKKIKFEGGTLPPEVIAGEIYKVGTVTPPDSFKLLSKINQPVTTTAPGNTTGIKVEKKTDIVQMFKGTMKQETWTALYSDDIAAGYNLVQNSTGTYKPLDPPTGNDTYLAMSIA